MAVFDQRHQTVKYQYNVNGSINFGGVHDSVEVVEELKKLQAEIVKAGESGAVDLEESADVELKLKKAIINVQKSEPDQNIIVGYLTEAKNILSNVAAVAGLVKGITEAIEIVRKFF